MKLMTFDEALAAVYQEVENHFTKDVVLVTLIEVRVYGWMFSWNARDYIETGDQFLQFIGNLNIFVTKKGAVIPVELRNNKEFLKRWEVENGLDYLYPEGIHNSDEVDELRRNYLRKLAFE